MNTMTALEQVVRLARLLMQQNITELSHTEVISCGLLVEPWQPGAFQAGDIRRQGGVIYECAQAHDSTANPAWTPESERALWFPWHADKPEWALPFVQPTGAHDQYKAGEYMTLDGVLYRCLSDTAYSPADYAQAWETVQT